MEGFQENKRLNYRQEPDDEAPDKAIGGGHARICRPSVKLIFGRRWQRLTISAIDIKDMDQLRPELGLEVETEQTGETSSDVA